MLLAIDIGNSQINTVVFEDDKIIESYRFNSLRDGDVSYYETELQKIGNLNITDCAIISVVNGLDYVIKDVCDKVFGIKSCVLDVNSVQKISLNTDNPSSVGMDRLANVYAASDYPLPAIVVDIGTAITFDILSEKKVFLGGIIMPGVNMELKALAEGTSKLPYIEPKESPCAIGNTTETCILSGAVRGTASAIDGLLKQCIEELGGCKTVILTGGQAELISEYMNYPISFVNQYWTMLGIKKIYECMI